VFVDDVVKDFKLVEYVVVNDFFLVFDKGSKIFSFSVEVGFISGDNKLFAVGVDVISDKAESNDSKDSKDKE
jgi:small neutral amino acid transporter SnatA (MarC family)